MPGDARSRAVNSAVPGATAVASPVESTRTLLEAELDHANFRCQLGAGVGAGATSRTVAPTGSVSNDGMRLKAGLGHGIGAFVARSHAESRTSDRMRTPTACTECKVSRAITFAAYDDIDDSIGDHSEASGPRLTDKFQLQRIK